MTVNPEDPNKYFIISEYHNILNSEINRLRLFQEIHNSDYPISTITLLYCIYVVYRKHWRLQDLTMWNRCMNILSIFKWYQHIMIYCHFWINVQHDTLAILGNSRLYKNSQTMLNMQIWTEITTTEICLIYQIEGVSVVEWLWPLNSNY